MNARDPHKVLIVTCTEKKAKASLFICFLRFFCGAFGKTEQIHIQKSGEMRKAKKEHQKALKFKFIGLRWHVTRNSINRG